MKTLLLIIIALLAYMILQEIKNEEFFDGVSSMSYPNIKQDRRW